MNTTLLALQERAATDPSGLLADAANVVHATRTQTWADLTEEQQRAVRNYDFHRAANNHRVGKNHCTKCLRTAARVLASA